MPPCRAMHNSPMTTVSELGDTVGFSTHTRRSDRSMKDSQKKKKTVRVTFRRKTVRRKHCSLPSNFCIPSITPGYSRGTPLGEEEVAVWRMVMC